MGDPGEMSQNNRCWGIQTGWENRGSWGEEGKKEIRERGPGAPREMGSVGWEVMGAEGEGQENAMSRILSQDTV